MRVKRIEKAPRIVLTIDEAMKVQNLLEKMAASFAADEDCKAAAEMSEKLDDALMVADSL